jgi:hypothetical protein
LNLADTEKAALVALLKATIAAYRFPLSPRVWALQCVLDKPEPPAPKPKQHLPPKPPGARSVALGRKQDRR